MRLCAHLIRTRDVFSHLAQMRYVCMFSERTVMLRGWPCNAFICDPKVQGALGPLFQWMLATAVSRVLEMDEPEYLVMIDAAIWPGLDALEQERLMFHELRHLRARENEYGVPKLDPEGRPMLRLVPHDIEVFEDEVAYYGPTICGIQDALPAIAEGLAVEKRSRLKIA